MPVMRPLPTDIYLRMKLSKELVGNSKSTNFIPHTLKLAKEKARCLQSAGFSYANTSATQCESS
jgi:hypothetical protein